MPSQSLPTPFDLERALSVASPRVSGVRTGIVSLAIHGGVLVLWLLLLSRALVADSLVGWSIGIAYIAYDTVLIAIVFRQTLNLLREAPLQPNAASAATLAVVVAARNEAKVIATTIRALLAQSDPPETILIADDGSVDRTASVLAAFGLAEPAVGALARSVTHPRLAWLRLPHGGKARALNAALLCIDTDVVVTVDGDTLLDPGATAALRRAFTSDPHLVAATGVLTPVCGPSPSGRFYEYFQTYEYIRNFLSRYAWSRLDALLLISGAFAGYRRDALLEVGGFDPVCVVEDYELVHRLRRHSALRGRAWTTRVVGQARAVTDAPSTTAAFLRQRRRWFCGFLQTQFWYRDMVGNRRFGRVGTIMLPIKALDTLQPIYGLAAFALLPVWLLTGRGAALLPVGAVILTKIGIDFAFHLWSVRLYRRWVDPSTRAGLGKALLASLAEPFTFQILRHTGAALGWLSFLTGDRAWGRQNRLGLVALIDRVPQADVALPRFRERKTR